MKHDILLAKWLNDEITIEELEMLKASPEYASYIKIAETVSKFKTPPFNDNENFDAISKKLKTKGKVVTSKPIAMFLKIAAVITILLVGYLFINSLDTTIETKIAEKQTFSLPDNSLVTLNANSLVNYNKKNWNENRELTLDGEAFFKVREGKKFTVNTSQGKVYVIGTQFNVFARDNFFYINCYEGRVNVAFNDTVVQLPAGNIIKIENNMLVLHTLTKVTTSAWTTDESNFENATLATVLKEFERQYPINITTQNINVTKRFSGTFTHNDLNLALKSVCEPLNLAYTINGEEDVTLYAKGSE